MEKKNYQSRRQGELFEEFKMDKSNKARSFSNMLRGKGCASTILRRNNRKNSRR